MNRSLVKQYLWSFGAGLFIFILLSIYLYLRRGYYDLYIANKVLAGVSFILLCFVLLLGTLSRLYQIFDHFMLYRKELGIMAFLFAFVHSIVSLFGLPDHFPLSYFMKLPVTFIFGLFGIGLLTVLFILSFEVIITKINRTYWWHIQNWGVRIAGIFILLHILPMKYTGWMRWYAQGGGNDLLRPYLPPAGLLVTSIGIATLIIRLAELLGQNISRRMISFIVILYVIFLGISFGIGVVRTPKALPLDWKTCVKLPNSKILKSDPPICIGTGERRAVQQ